LAYRVKGLAPFWKSVDEVADADLLDELYTTCFELLESGPALSGATETVVPLPPIVLAGWFYELPSGRAFITYGEWAVDELMLVRLTLTDYPDI
jgi:hypothetical protein